MSSSLPYGTYQSTPSEQTSGGYNPSGVYTYDMNARAANPYQGTPGGVQVSLGNNRAINEMELQKNMTQYINGNPAPLSFTSTSPLQTQAAIDGLNLGKIMTGQTIYQTGAQVQDALKRSQGLVTGNNPVTGEMIGQRNAAVSRAGNELAKSGVRGGAAVAAKQQVGSAMDKQIATQAHQQYTQNLQNHLKTLAGVQSAQLTPMYTSQDTYLSSTVPGYERSGGGFLEDLFK